MNPGDPRTLDAYRYAENNPVVFTDASGLFAACSGVSGAAETACLAAYSSGTKRALPASGELTTTYTNSPPTNPQSSAAFRRATEIAYDQMVSWMRSEDAQQIMRDGAANAYTFNEVLSGGIKYSRFSIAQPSTWGDGALGVLSLGSFLTDPSGAGPKAIKAGRTLAAMFPDRGPWDIKPMLRQEFGFDKMKPEDARYGLLTTADGGQIFCDVLGNVQYGIMMNDFGVTADIAASASHTNSAGNPDTQDDVLINLGYEFRQNHPGDFTSGDLYAFLTRPSTLRALQ